MDFVVSVGGPGELEELHYHRGSTFAVSEEGGLLVVTDSDARKIVTFSPSYWRMVTRSTSSEVPEIEIEV